jgi:hypothetical protein
MTIGRTGASGRLGGLVAGNLMRRIDPKRISLPVRNPERVASLADAARSVRRFNYDDPTGMKASLAGITTLFMVSAVISRNFYIMQCAVRPVAQISKSAGFSDLQVAVGCGDGTGKSRVPADRNSDTQHREQVSAPPCERTYGTQHYAVRPCRVQAATSQRRGLTDGCGRPADCLYELRRCYGGVVGPVSRLNRVQSNRRVDLTRLRRSGRAD